MEYNKKKDNEGYSQQKGKYKSIKRKLVMVTLIMVLIPILTITALNYYIDSSNIVENAEVNNNLIAESIAQQLEIYMNSLFEMIEMVAGAHDFTEMSNHEINLLFNSYSFKYKDFKAFQYIDTKGNVVVSNGKNRTANVSDQQWFKTALGGELYVTPSIGDKQASDVGLIIAVPLRKGDGNRGGVMTVLLGFDQVINLVKDVSIGETGYAYVVDNEGYIIGHRVASEYVYGRFNVYEEGTEDIKRIAAGELDLTQGINSEGKDILIASSSVGDLNWRVIVEQDKDEILEVTQDTFIRNILIALVFIIITSIMIYTFANYFIKPIRNLVVSANKIKDGDLRERINVDSDNEIGQLQMAFNEMSTSISHIIKQIIGTTNEVSGSIDDLMNNANMTSRAASEISKTIEHVALGTSEQMASVDKSTGAVEKMVDGVKKVNENAATVVTSAEKASLMAYNGVESIDEIKNTMAQITAVAQNTFNLVSELDKHIKEIDRAGQLITQISDQTNLLALNAAIEAARAGEHGKGFTVVAEEVRKLAEQSRNASKEIINLIGKIQNETGMAVDAMEKGIESVEVGNKVINKTTSSFNNILEETKSVTALMKGLSSVIQQVSQEVSEVEGAIADVAGVSQSTAAGAEEVLASVQEQDASIQHMTNSTIALGEMIKNLEKLTTKFLIDNCNGFDEGSQKYETDNSLLSEEEVIDEAPIDKASIDEAPLNEAVDVPEEAVEDTAMEEDIEKNKEETEGLQADNGLVSEEIENDEESNQDNEKQSS
ncbi:methyl-accepting chemotaxis protein [Alkaliphilus pronyensis]|nr:methyl-accepting chemotaxis protein [Alkaliphilus pronyensis]